ncbi:MAG TPA: DUF488 family protein [Candidatus Sulfotelmatobacter sp.]|jgi:uncharacterized protein YeaO (DUF488 family)|nr:DUF488 family protein [Candidatus Sulfotelmatobacter sp.]
MNVAIKRVYAAQSSSDGARVLVDRLWPRGLSKASADIDEWLRDLAPTDDLRRWYHARPNEWPEFRRRYLKELRQPECEESLSRLYQVAGKRKRLTLLFASKDETRNNAAVLKELLDGARKPPTGTGPGGVQTVHRREAAVRRR